MKGYFKQLNMLFMALFLGIALMVAVFYLIRPKEQVADGNVFFDNKLLFGLLVLTGVGGSFILNQLRINGATTLQGLEAKALYYRSSVILRLAFLEGILLLMVIFFFITGATSILLYMALGMAVFYYLRPSVNDFVQHVGLNQAEKQSLERELSE